MAIPVPIPSGPLTISDAENARAEAFVAAIGQILRSGTTGSAITTPASTIPIPNSTEVAAIDLVGPDDETTAQNELFYRQMGIAIAKTLSVIVEAPEVDVGEDNTASNLGDGVGVFAQKFGVDLQFKSLKEGPNISIVQNANEITLSASVESSSDPRLSMTCSADLAVGTLVYVSGEMACEAADPTLNAKMPCVGIVVEKTSSTVAVVQCVGVVDVSATLAPGTVYFVGLNGVLSATPPAGAAGQLRFLQSVGVAVGVHKLMLVPSFSLDEYWSS